MQDIPMCKPLFALTAFCLIISSCTASRTSNENVHEEMPYTSYFMGNESDITVDPSYGITMMGGRSEQDDAMRWFLGKANGGDVLVLRASGSDGYNNYLFNELGVPINSVESIVIDNAEAANHPYVLNKIKKAEAIWLAGGNQFNYISIWGNSPIKNLLNDHINVKRGAIGGTSAGMAVLGEWYFSTAKGSVKSEQALANPFHELVTLDKDFLSIPILNNTITDTHFANRDRQGRLSVFMARMYQSSGDIAYGIACDEYTAVCIGEDGIGKTYGRWPDDSNSVYFVRSNCEKMNPEDLEAEKPFSWFAMGKALDVYRIIPDSTGSKTFNLNDWYTGNGGEWLNWTIDLGQWMELDGRAPECKR